MAIIGAELPEGAVLDRKKARPLGRVIGPDLPEGAVLDRKPVEPRPVTPGLTEAMAGFGVDKSPDTAIEVLDFHKETGLNNEFIENNLDSLKKNKAKGRANDFILRAPATTGWGSTSPHHMALAQEDEEALTTIEGKVKPKERGFLDALLGHIEDPVPLIPIFGQVESAKRSGALRGAALRQAERTELAEKFAEADARAKGTGGELTPEEQKELSKSAEELGFKRFPIGVPAGIEGPVMGFGRPKFKIPTEEEDLVVLLEAIEQGETVNTVAAGALDLFAHAPAFLAEFGIGMGLTKPIKPLVKRQVGKALEKFFTKAGRANLTKRAIELGISTTAGGARLAAATPLILGPTIAKNTLENASPGFKFTQKETGELGVILTDEGDDAITAFLKGFGDAFIEVGSERSGFIFNIAGSAIKKQVTNVAFKSGFLKKLFKANPDKNPREVLRAFNDLIKKSGWNGIVAEIGEEELGKAARFVFLGKEYKLTTGKELITMVLGFGAVSGSISTLGGTLNKISVTRETERKADLIKDISEDVKNSKLHKRSPELFKEVVDRMAEGSGVENVSIPVAAWDKYFEELDLDPRLITEELLGDAGLYDVAVEEGKDIEMSFGDYAAGIAATEHNEPLSEELKISGAIDIGLADELVPEPPVITPAREARIESERLRKELAEVVEKARIRTEKILEGQIPTESERIVQDVTTQLEAAGINTEDARLQAEILYGEPFRLLAERAGLTPQELFEQFGPTITREGVEGEGFEQAERPTLFGEEITTLEQGAIEDLFAGHNLTAENIAVADELGGLAVPSIGISRVGTGGFEGFGDITLLADKELVDPRTSRTNKVFNADVYSPRFPRVEHKINQKKFSEALAFLAPADKALGGRLWELDTDSLEEKGVMSFANSTVVQYAFLASKKQAPKIKLKKKDDLPEYLTRFESFGPEEIRGLEFQEAVLRYMREELPEEDIEDKSLVFQMTDELADAVTRFHKPRAIDFYATRTVIEEGMVGKDKAFNKWIQENFEDVFVGKRIFKGFSYTGRRTYLPYDLDTTVKILKKGLRDGEGFDYGVGSIRSNVARQFKSIKQVQEARGDIVSSEDLTAAKEETDAEFFALTEKLKPFYRFNANEFQYLDATSAAFKDLALIGRREFNETFLGVPEELMEEIGSFMQKLRNMPSEYFEVKMQRAVGLDEFKTAVVPQDTPKKTIGILKKNGLKIVQYDPRQKGSRVEAIGEQTDVLFQAEERKGIEGAVPRASIAFGPTGVNINLFASADTSSLIHETGHLYLRILDNLAQREGASEDLKQDHKIVLDWLDAEPGAKLTVAQQEKWARGIELYLRDGKAPTAALREAFARFKEWLISVYESALQLNVELSPEVRSVMDRLLASKEDIEDISDEVDRAVINLAIEGKPLEDITNADIEELVPEAKPSVTSKVKKNIRDAVGLNKKPGLALFELISKDKSLEAAFKKSLKAAREAFRAGKKAGVAKENKRMNDIAERVKARTDKKVDKILTDKQKQQNRRRVIRVIRDYLGLSDAQMTRLTKRRNLGLMDDYEFKTFKDKLLLEAERAQEEAIAKSRVAEIITRKRLQKINNYRNLLDLPPHSQMTVKQLEEWGDALEVFEEGDVFIGPRQLETVRNTPIADVKTWRQAKEALAKMVSKREGREVTVEDLSNIIPPSVLDKTRFDSNLVERDPFFRMLVEETTKSLFDAELRAHDMETELFKLARASQKSQGLSARIKGFILPQDKQIMAYMEAEESEKPAHAEGMTPEQMDLAYFMNHYFAGALEYLKSVDALNDTDTRANTHKGRARKNYFVHIRRSFLENLKEGGFIKAVKELIKNNEEDAEVFTILRDERTKKILPLNKHFKFAMKRSGNLDPTSNVTKAFLIYMRTLEKKKAIDSINPMMDIYVQAVSPVETTATGLELDPRLKDFTYQWLNNKKGRKFDFGGIVEQGRKVDLALVATRTFTSMLDLGGNLFVGAASLVGELSGNYVMIGSRGMAKGTARQLTKKGQAILQKYEAFVGRSAWQEFWAPGKELPERLMEGLFMLFHINTVQANKQFLLASLTKEEYDKGEISSQRLTEMRLAMGRFRVVPGTESILGSTSVIKTLIQYKKWAVPMLRTTAADLSTLVSDLKAKPVGEALTTREAREIPRILMLTTVALIVSGAADEDDDSFLGKLKAKMRRESLSLMQSWDPALWLSVPRTWTFLQDLVINIKDLITLEEYETRPGLKGAVRLRRQFTPAIVRNIPVE